MLTILHVAPHLQAGGTAQMSADLACALQQRGDSRNIIVSPPNELVSQIRAHGVEHRLCRKANLFNIPAEILRIRGIVAHLQPDIVQSYSAESALICTLACRKFKETKPSHIEVITSYPHRDFKRFFHRGSQVFVTISKHLRQVTTERILQKRRRDIKLIPYGVNHLQCYPDYRPDSRDTTRATDAHHNLTLCIPGPITPLHGLENLVPLLKTLEQQGISAHTHIIGDLGKAAPAYVQKLKQLYTEAHVAERISWLGACTDLRDKLSTCDIILSLSHRPASYNRPILEALSLGRPVVGFDHGVVGELLESFLPEGRVAPGDIDGVADTIIQWNTYRPGTITDIPYPYRICDTAESFFHLYESVLRKDN